METHTFVGTSTGVSPEGCGHHGDQEGVGAAVQEFHQGAETGGVGCCGGMGTGRRVMLCSGARGVGAAVRLALVGMGLGIVAGMEVRLDRVEGNPVGGTAGTGLLVMLWSGARSVGAAEPVAFVETGVGRIVGTAVGALVGCEVGILVGSVVSDGAGTGRLVML